MRDVAGVQSFDDVEVLIDRSVRGEATADEVRRLAAWRRESADNERCYRRTVRLLDVARRLGSARPAP